MHLYCSFGNRSFGIWNRGLVALTLGLGVSFLALSHALAQEKAAAKSMEYKFKKDSKEFREKKTQVDAMLKKEAPLNIDVVAEYFKGFYLPHMTQVDHPEYVNDVRNGIVLDLDNLHGKGLSPEDILKYNTLLGAAPAQGKTQGLLVSVARAASFQLAARVNAVHLLGYLDASRKKDGTIAPFAPATGELLKILKDKSLPDYIRVSAIPGLRRHALNFKEQRLRDAIGAALLEVMAEPQPASRTDAVQIWIQRECVDILSLVPGAHDAKLREFIVATLHDKNSHYKLRYVAAMATGRLTWDNVDTASKIATGLAHYTFHQSNDWLTLITNTITPPSAGMGGMMGGGGSDMYGGGAMGGSDMYGGGAMGGSDMYGSGGMGSGDMYGSGMGGTGSQKKESLAQLQPPEVRMFRRHLHTILDSVRFSLSGTMAVKEVKEVPKTGIALALANHEHAPTITKILDKIREIQLKANLQTIRDLPALKKEVDPLIKELVQLTEEFPGVEDIDFPVPTTVAEAEAPKAVENQ